MNTEKKLIGMGRPKQFHERLLLPLPKGETARIDLVLSDGETRLDMIREAIEREIKRRQESPVIRKGD